MVHQGAVPDTKTLNLETDLRFTSFSRVTELQLQGLRPSAPQHYEYIFNRVIVEFKPKNEEDTALQTYSIELSRKSSYDQVNNRDNLNSHLLHENQLTATTLLW